MTTSTGAERYPDDHPRHLGSRVPGRGRRADGRGRRGVRRRSSGAARVRVRCADLLLRAVHARHLRAAESNEHPRGGVHEGARSGRADVAARHHAGLHAASRPSVSRTTRGSSINPDGSAGISVAYTARGDGLPHPSRWFGDRTVLQNNSIRSSYIADPPPIYAEFLTRLDEPGTTQYQVAGATRIGDADATMNWAIDHLKASGVELVNGYTTFHTDAESPTTTWR